MFWFAVLVMMANALNKYGMISWISERIVGYVGHFEWITVFLLLVVVYFYTRYFFASAMAHISAMYLAFLAVAVSVGVPPLFAALVLGYTSNLSMGLTQYSGARGPRCLVRDITRRGSGGASVSWFRWRLLLSGWYWAARG
jgi:DASS family divalent anion:Na+ symporter